MSYGTQTPRSVLMTLLRDKLSPTDLAAIEAAIDADAQLSKWLSVPRGAQAPILEQRDRDDALWAQASAARY